MFKNGIEVAKMFDFQPQSNRFIPQLDDQSVFLLIGQRCQIGKQQAQRCIGLGHPEIPLVAALFGLFRSLHPPIAEKFPVVPYFLVWQSIFFSEEKSPFRTARIFVEKNALKPGVVTFALGAERAFLTWPS